MASAKKKPGKKYTHLQGQVPEVPQVAPGIDKREDAIRSFQEGNPRAQAEEAAIKEGRPLTPREDAFPEGQRQTWTVDQVTDEFNRLKEVEAKIALASWTVKVQLEANERLIKKKIEALGAERVTMNGYTWSPSPRPCGVVFDPGALIKHYIDNGMQSMLTIHPSRVDSHVREEAEANTLQVVILEEKGPDGEDVTEIRSSLPGVKVFLKSTLSRVKASAGAATPEPQEELSDE